jgi:hypothetical protein
VNATHCRSQASQEIVEAGYAYDASGEAVITGAEAATVAKAGASIVQGIKTTLAQPEANWPNAAEALMELFIILDDWCQSAQRTNEVARAALRARSSAHEPPKVYEPMSQMATPSPFNVSHGYIEHTTRDIEGVLNPSVPWFKAWRRSNKRAAARRTLRSMLRIYCPDLLDSFEEAAANRAAWVTEHRRGFTATLEDPQTPVEKLRTMVDRLEATLRDLQATRAQLRTLIRQSYPMLATDWNAP